MDETSELSLEEAVIQLEELMQRNRTDSARVLLGRMLPVYPDSVELLSCSVWLDWVENDYAAAKLTIAQILASDPKHYFARYVLAQIHEDTEDYAASEEQLLGLLADYPQDSTLYAVYARVMLATFHFEKAERLAAEALKISPEDETALNVSVFCAFINAPGEETEARLHQLMVEHPDQMQTTIRLIQVLSDQGKNEQAYELAKQLVRLQPDNQSFVEMATGFKVSTHWSMKPMWPMLRFGWGGSIALWFLVVIVLRTGVLETLGIDHLATPFAFLFIGYVVYSWVWPPIISRLLK